MVGGNFVPTIGVDNGNPFSVINRDIGVDDVVVVVVVVGEFVVDVVVSLVKEEVVGDPYFSFEVIGGVCLLNCCAWFEILQ